MCYDVDGGKQWEFTFQLTRALEQLRRLFGRSWKKNLFHEFSELSQPSFVMQLVKGVLEKGNNTITNSYCFLLLFCFPKPPPLWEPDIATQKHQQLPVLFSIPGTAPVFLYTLQWDLTASRSCLCYRPISSTR